MLKIEDLHASIDGTDILRGISLDVSAGEVHAIMGPNGSGKSTLASVLMGHPGYEVTAGRILYMGEDIAEWSPDERGRSGMFLGFQYPEEIPGVSVVNFLRTALSNKTGVEYTVLELRLKVMDAMRELGMDASFADRYLNEGFSGGERKRNEILQLAVLEQDRDRRCELAWRGRVEADHRAGVDDLETSQRGQDRQLGTGGVEGRFCVA